MKKLTALFAILAVAVLASQVGSCGGGGGSSDGGPPPLPVPPFTPPAPIDWTTLSPSGDTRTIYVSDSAGDDTQDGLTEPTAKKTIAAGKALLRTGFPDWLLLKAGDTFTDQSIGGWALSGRSVSEPMVVGSYGTGDRPLIQTGTAHGVATTGASVSHVAFVGLHLTPHSYTGTQGSSGMVWLAVSDDILVEDCLFEGFRDGLVVQAFDGPVGSIKDFRIRRSVIVESWASGSFSQGLFAYGIYGLLVEDCLFDHNGWKEGPGGSPPTIFNQNTYVHDCSNVTMRGNLVLRAANLGNKFRSDNTGGSRGMLIEDNVYIEGAVAISCGGNSSSAHRFANITVHRNLMMNIGRTNPNGQDIGWYLSLSDWNGGLIEDNLFLYQTQFNNGFGVSFEGSSERDVEIRDNLFYALQSRNLILPINGTNSGILVSGNEFQDPSEGGFLVAHSGSFGPVDYQSNVYSTVSAASDWFFVNSINTSYAQWVAASGETGSSVSAITYSDPGRDETTYMTSLGGTPTLAAFAAEARLQSRANWRPEYTAVALNNYVRAGFDR